MSSNKETQDNAKENTSNDQSNKKKPYKGNNPGAPAPAPSPSRKKS